MPDDNEGMLEVLEQDQDPDPPCPAAWTAPPDQITTNDQIRRDGPEADASLAMVRERRSPQR